MAADVPPALPFSNLTKRFLDARQWQRALEAALQWLAAAPEDVQARLAIARCQVNLKRYIEARRHLERVVQSNPANDYALRLMAIATFELREYQTADRAITDAIIRNPRDPWHWYQLGNMCQRWQDMAAAKVFLREAESLAPREAAIVALQAYCEPENSMNRMRLVWRALELDPEDPDLHHEVGKFHLHVMRDYACAEACFRQALSLAPTNQKYRDGLFTAIRHRDRIYAILSAPGQWVRQLIAWGHKIEKLPSVLTFLLFPVLLYAGWLLLMICLIWGGTFMPLAAAYEWLTLKDIATRAGELGGRRRWYALRTWPFKWRMGLLTLVFGGIWAMTIQWYADPVYGFLAPVWIVGLLLSYGIWKVCRSNGRARDPMLPLRARPPDIDKLCQETLRRQGSTSSSAAKA